MSRDMVYEDAPKFSSRVGDHVIYGSNNTLIVLGRDRAKNGPASVDDGLGSAGPGDAGKGTGTVHIVAGLDSSSGDPDFSKDRSFVYVSMKTDADKNLDMKNGGRQNDPAAPAVIVKSDLLRFVCRKNSVFSMEDSKSYVVLEKDRSFVSVADGSSTFELKDGKAVVSIKGGATITVEKGTVTVDADNIKLGKNAVEKILKGDSFKAFFLGHKHPTGVGTSGPPIDLWDDKQLMSQRKALVE